MKIVINRSGGVVSLALRAGYGQFYCNNFLRQDGFKANGVLEITREEDEAKTTG